MFNKIEERLTKNLIILILIALISGGLISILVFRIFITKPAIGIVKISGPIGSQKQVDAVEKALRHAKEKKAIKGIVIEIDSPGGVASLIEEIYLAVLRLREEKPVVTSISDEGVSGGYYIAIASNFIFTKPDSQIGNIGALTILPKPKLPSENLLTTGPYKDIGSSRRKAVGQLDMLRQSFLQAVLFHRQEKLKIGAEELVKAEIYTGLEGFRNGLIDEIGSSFDAIKKAAEYAGIAHYRIVDVAEELAKEKPRVDWKEMLSKETNQLNIESENESRPVYYLINLE